MLELLTQYYGQIILSIILSLILTELIRKWLVNRRILAQPRSRDIHTVPVPRFGGVAIFGTFWLVILISLLIQPDIFDFTKSKVLGLDKNLFGILLGSLVIFGFGLYDDRYGMNWKIKLTGQIIAALIVVSFGIKIPWLSSPFGGIFDLGIFSVIFVIFWLVLIMNTINWLDGLDGLASGISAIAVGVLAILAFSLQVPQPATALLGVILFGALIGFLPWNFHPAKIFLGDSGSLFLGFIIGIMAIVSGGKVATAALVLGLPILDVIWVILRRLKEGHSPFLADQKHLHHRLLQAGFNVRQSVIFMYLVSLIFGLIALNSQTYDKIRAGISLIMLLLILGVVLVYAPQWKKGHKINVGRK